MDPTRLPLHDIHLPEPVSWWPPAPGWWLLFLAIIGTICACTWFWYRRRKYLKSHAHHAQVEIRKLREEYSKHGDCKKLARDLSVLFRRITISIFPRDDSAGLAGKAWLEFLDKSVPSELFSEGPGKVLITAPYQARPEIDAEALLLLSEKWIRSVTEKKRAGDDTF